MTEYTLRGMEDGELDALVLRLEAQLRLMALSETSLGRRLAEQYRAALAAARIEAQRRSAD